MAGQVSDSFWSKLHALQTSANKSADGCTAPSNAANEGSGAGSSSAVASTRSGTSTKGIAASAAEGGNASVLPAVAPIWELKRQAMAHETARQLVVLHNEMAQMFQAGCQARVCVNTFDWEGACERQGAFSSIMKFVSAIVNSEVYAKRGRQGDYVLPWAPTISHNHSSPAPWHFSLSDMAVCKSVPDLLPGAGGNKSSCCSA